MAGIDLAGVSRVYPGGIVAVDRLDLEVRDGELLVLVGPSGSGKTTLLRLIAGLDRPSAGQVWIGGRLVDHLPPRDRDVALVFQSHALFPHLDVRENLAFGLRLRTEGSGLRRAWRRLIGSVDAVVGRARIEAEVQEIATVLGIAGLLGRRTDELSGGQQQRVALGRALVRRPKTLLLDEPLAHLDTALRGELRLELRRLQRERKITTVYVTHDEREALALGDRVVVLNRGVVEQMGTPDQVYDEPANRFVAGFVGSPPMNFWEGQWIAGGDGQGVFQTPNWSVPVDNSAPQGLKRFLGMPLVLGLRPGDLYLEGERPASTSGFPLSSLIETVESAGDSTLITLACGAAEQRKVIRVKSAARGHRKAGERVRVGFDMRRAHWFEGRTGRTIADRTG